MDNLRIYNKFAPVPDTAKRTIGAGRLKGKTDINPMFRIKTLTEMFGPCGIGWDTQNVRYHLHTNDNTGEVVVICELELVYKENDTWSKPVYGVGGNMLISLENGYLPNGTKGKVLYTNDEAFKMAYTDAISVASKALGGAASVYWEADYTKYTQQKNLEAYGLNASPATAHVEPANIKKNTSPTPVQMQKTETVYSPKAEIEKIKTHFGVDDIGFARMRETLIAGGVVPKKDAKDMTEADCKQLFAAIWSNFGDGEEA